MGIGTTGGVTGVLTAALFSAKSWMFPQPTSNIPDFYHHVEITPKGGIFSDWNLNKDGYELNGCDFWNATHYYAPRVCDAFGVSRISMSSGAKAVERSIKCGAEYDSECILSGEIGFSAPAAFLYDSENGFRMVLAPRILQPEFDESDDRTFGKKLIRLQDPSKIAPDTFMSFNNSVTIEYINPGSRAVITETLIGQEAYCVQALRASVSPSCWENLD